MQEATLINTNMTKCIMFVFLSERLKCSYIYYGFVLLFSFLHWKTCLALKDVNQNYRHNDSNMNYDDNDAIPGRILLTGGPPTGVLLASLCFSNLSNHTLSRRRTPSSWGGRPVSPPPSTPTQQVVCTSLTCPGATAYHYATAYHLRILAHERAWVLGKQEQQKQQQQ